MKKPARLGPVQARYLALRANGYIPLASKGFDALKDRGLVDKEWPHRLTDDGREALEAHMNAGRPIDGFKRLVNS